MADILGIGASGLTAYRKSLEVIGNNIVNANTEGYAKRSAQLQTIASRAATPTTLVAGGGSGVVVDKVARATDSFLQARMWNAVSDSARAEALAENISRLERGLLTTPTTINTAVQSLFSRLQDLSASPTSIPARQSVLDAADQVVGQFRSQEAIVASELDAAVTSVEAGLQQVNILTRQLASLNGELLRSSASNPALDIMDQRDKLLGDLSKLVGITVREGPTGAVEVHLGDSSSGPELISGRDVLPLQMKLVGEKIEIIVDPYKTNSITNELKSGAIAGAMAYFHDAAQARDDINRLAVAFADMMNRQHRLGVDLSGKDGAQLFSTQSLEAKPEPRNSGSGEIRIDVSGATTLQNLSYAAVYDADADLWTVTSSNRASIVKGRNEVTIDQIRFTFSGTPENGDVFTVAPLENAAAGMRLLVSDPSKIAVALPRYADPSNTNVGTADIRLESGMGDTSAPDLPGIQDVLGRSLSPASAVRLNRDGVLAAIPSGARDVTLASLGSLSAAAFLIEEKDVLAQTSPSMRFRLGDSQSDTVVNFTLAGGSAKSFADSINTALKAQGLDDQLYASSSAGILTVNALGGTSIAELSVAGLERTVSPLEAGRSGSEILLFTREGRQLTGSPLGIADAAALLTAENGFRAEAVYASPADTTNYRNLLISNVSAPLSVSARIDGSRRVEISAMPEIDGVQTDNTGSPLAGAVYALDVTGLPDVRLAGDDIAGLGAEAITDRLMAALLIEAPRRSVKGAEFALGGSTTDRLSFTVKVNGLEHRVTFERSKDAAGNRLEGGVFAVDGPLALRFGLSFDATKDVAGGKPYALTMIMPPALNGGDAPDIVFDGTAAATLGMSAATTTKLEAGVPATAGGTLQVFLGGAIREIAIGSSGSGSVTHGGATLDWSYDPDGRLALESEDPDLQVLATNADRRADAAALGFKGADLTVERMNVIRGKDVPYVDPATRDAALDEGRVVNVAFGGSTSQVFISGETGSFTKLAGTEVPVILTWSIENGRLALRSTASDLRIVESTAADRQALVDLGLAETERSSAEISVLSTVPDATTVDASKSVSRIASSLTLRGPIPEDLIVVMRGGEVRSVVGRFPQDMMRVDPVIPDIKVEILSGSRVAIIDRNSDVRLAERAYVEGEPVEYQGLRFSVSGIAQPGDEFTIVRDVSRTGDARNALLLAELRTKDSLGPGSGSFQDVYIAAAARIASAGQSANLTAESAGRAASDLMGAFENRTSVNLDDEAADLMRYQQAYQAAARVVMTARDMFDTILKAL